MVKRVVQFILLFSLFLLVYFTLIYGSESDRQKPTQQLLHIQEKIEGNLRIVEYVDDYKQLTVNKALGYATMIQYLDEANRPIKESYYDEKGNPCIFTAGYYGIQRNYTAEGLVSSYSYCDEYGQLTIAGKGCATVRQSFYDDGRIKEERYYDLCDLPVPLSLWKSKDLRIMIV